jgi:hypothetical protein
MSVVQCHEDSNGYLNSIDVLNFLTSVGDGIVGTVARCGLDSSECESRWGKRVFLLFITFQTDPGTYPASYSIGLIDSENNVPLRNVGTQIDRS